MADGPERALVVYADGPDGPLPDPDVIESLVGRPVSVLLGFVVRRPAWLSSTGAELSTVLVGPGVRAAVAEGKVRSVPQRLSAMPGLLSGRLRPDVAVVGAYEVPTGSGWRMAGGPGYALAAVRAARGVIIERWGARPAGAGPGDGPAAGPVPAMGPHLPPGPVLAVLDRREPPDPAPETRPSAELAVIARTVASLIPDRATIQWGPGALGPAVVSALERPVRVRSGLVTGELAGLAGRGLLIGAAETAYLWGGAELHLMVGSGRVVLKEVAHTHDLTALSGIERFVAVNAALQVGLDGAVNVESVGGRVVSGPGGHPDFAAGAARSPGGLSIVALPSVAAGRSTIVRRPDVVSTPRSDVDLVVTEHGVADLRGLTDRERAGRMIQVAAPEFRSELAAAAGSA